MTVSLLSLSHNFDQGTHDFALAPPEQGGRNLVILKVGRRYIYNTKDEIIHGRSPSVKCIVPLFREMSLGKV